MRKRDNKAIMTVGRNIAKYRALKGWTVDKLSVISNTEASSISEYEMGQKDIGISVLVRLSRALEIHPGQLFDDVDQ